MAFDAFSVVQSLADGNRSFGDVVKDLSTAELADLREQVQIQLKDMPKNGDPARAERLQQLRTLLKGSVRSMIGTLAASLAFSQATGISLEPTESASPEKITKQITAPETRIVAEEARTKSTVSAFDKPAEQIPASATALAPAAAEKPALSYADYKNMTDPKKEKNFFQNAMGYMSYRAARFIAKSSAKDSVLGKMFKKFGWDKNATALTALMESGVPDPTPETKKPPESVLPVAPGPQTNLPPSVTPAPPPSIPPAPPAVSVPAAPTPTLPVQPAAPDPSPIPAPVLPPAPTPAPEKPADIPALITFDQFKSGVDILGTRVLVDGNTITVGTKKWELVKKVNVNPLPFGSPTFVSAPVVFTDVEWKNDVLHIAAGLREGPLKNAVALTDFPTNDFDNMPKTDALAMLNHLSTQSTNTEIKKKVRNKKTGIEKEEVVALLVPATK